jgi:hypothetical protein
MAELPGPCTARSPLLLFSTACTDWTPPEREATTGMDGITLSVAMPADESTGWPFPGHGSPEVIGSVAAAAAGDDVRRMEASGSSAGIQRSVRPGCGGRSVGAADRELLPDPAGKDGGAASPEFVEILHVGGEPTALAGLEIVARAWPIQSAADLGIADRSSPRGSAWWFCATLRRRICRTRRS